MRVVLPGKPQAKLQAICTTEWEGQRIVVRPWSTIRVQKLTETSKAYISGSALIILGGPHNIIQTVYHDASPHLDTVAIDEATGKIAVSDSQDIYVYRPYGKGEGALKVNAAACKLP